MKVKFNVNGKLPSDEVVFTISANKLTEEVKELMQTIEKKELGSQSEVVPVTLFDKIIMLKKVDVIAVEDFGDELTIYAIQGKYQAREPMYRFIRYSIFN
ncbi:hypothetical protein ACWN8V_09925 [Vagococcus elongatus]|uniref:Uncharacterized protein n=1 Tax=Vagococcus elongatus TaxID=180344 RepID=A0A430AQC5_9ENTE|nr:hypothetical protein [Vagococcus elongatus]RSU10322.1 hypothetical protein CBF29_09935 [Vagococcus elongatus]